ncbi:hypothetical protein CKM354_000689800 [Cercospora kikuchii]|uniref:Tyrosinase copper-binding domain-containing protein n=1 Tax=Cercospora kikuchii TaxID=84275 RepID=A0A9P3FDS5_9PEZI|nr:uncharacterized protein CKM354_000689800 [Cercospora kikuchii]GIZ43681.1 hypothetical protein CKM354_000689800 [Cercospora kikuchii]
MRLSWLTLLSAGLLQRSSASDNVGVLSQLAAEAFENAYRTVSQSSSRYTGRKTCTLKNLSIRQEWGSLSKPQRKDYIRAVQCLQTKPPRTPSTFAPGAKSRFDDFVVTHINQTQTVHLTANFLSWHRYYIWLYEKALREECGYKGYQPYWDWSITAETGLLASPIFDGSDTSMGGNGAYVGNRSDIVLGAEFGLPPVYLPTGSGGGCVGSGPFENMTVNLGPVALDSPGGVSQGPPSGGPLDWNPRCLRRDLTDAVNRRWANASSVVSLISNSKNVYDFQMTMQGVPGSGEIGVHGGGHYSIGGDPGNDVFVSPGEPIFYLHHAMIDRVWWIWQHTENPFQRQFSDEAISGTRTLLDMPPSANATLDDIIDFQYAAGPARPIRDFLSTVDGPFCYVYL